MANRERKIYMLSKKNVDYIEKVKEKRDLKYNSEAIDLIIREHRINSDTTTEVMMNLIGEKISEQLKVELSGIKKASNQTDKNTQIIIELLNGLFVKSGYSILATTDDIKCEAIDRTIENIINLIKERLLENLKDELQ